LSLLPIFIYKYLSMKKLFLLLFSMVTLGAAVHAQDSTTATRHQHERGAAVKQQRTDMMQQLNLTDEQKTKLQKLHEEQRAKMDSIRNSNVSDDEKTAQLKALRENQRKTMEEVLTPEQKTKWQQLRAAQMEKRKAKKQDTDSTE
jgi:Spy/CpxP family protein refolding chaperone